MMISRQRLQLALGCMQSEQQHHICRENLDVYGLELLLP